MEKILEKIKKLLELMGVNEPGINFNETNKRISLSFNDYLDQSELPRFLEDLEYVINLICQKETQSRIWLDINNYRRERERLIVELARTAAHKSALNKEEVSLPAMNAYERRLVHLEIASRPDLKTESAGEGKERRVIIKPIL
jgi:predicted RNA-binding protein Jag